MNIMSIKIYAAALAVLAAVVVSGVAIFGGSQEVVPEVSEQNCRQESIKTIQDKALREEFANKCFWRSKPGTSADVGF
jgi:entry exclusion lipoprotein TrbK